MLLKRVKDRLWRETLDQSYGRTQQQGRHESSVHPEIVIKGQDSQDDVLGREPHDRLAPESISAGQSTVAENGSLRPPCTSRRVDDQSKRTRKPWCYPNILLRLHIINLINDQSGPEITQDLCKFLLLMQRTERGSPWHRA